MQFWNSFGTETAVEAAMDLQGTLNLKGLNGGRDRTRTCDLLRVKNVVWFISTCLFFLTSYRYGNPPEKTEVCPLMDARKRTWKGERLRWYTGDLGL